MGLVENVGKVGKMLEKVEKTWHIRTFFDAFIIQWKGSRENLIAVETMAFLWTRVFTVNFPIHSESE